MAKPKCPMSNDQKTKANVYVDGANIFYTQKKLGWSIDWTKARTFLEKQFNILVWKYYTGVKKNDAKMDRYLRRLNAIGFTVMTKPLKVIATERGHIYKSNFDVEIATDMAFDRNSVDAMILFSGDSDFEYIRYILHERQYPGS